MRTKFSQLLQIKKEALKEMERMILVTNQKIEREECEIQEILRAIIAIEIPSFGTYSEFMRIQEIKKNHIEEMDFKRTEISRLKSERALMHERLKELNLDYEKAKYLENLEIQKILARKKAEANAEMDEISLMLHNTRILNASGESKK